ncbi:uroporphyrinogen-III synthase [Cellulomonas sp. JH27-2]|uniref:uroporphyrinogen-III synthase n=1 Tax=Cellulomonas sp. JH27-2 TaxID=2774139 RepID=UPI00177A9DA4|nr:uroporphyrinogen-III synthase [Cellulomonas sp. JH27-2]MBD8058121.1 uroporphyrinogen-III synthase [Cellulomonas sp. JH27-2]
MTEDVTRTPGTAHSGGTPHPADTARSADTAHSPGITRATGALAGWRVLVPRPTAGASPAVMALAAAGAVADVVPLIATVPPQDTAPLDDALLALGAGWYPWLAVTSAAAVPVLEQRAAAAGRTLADLVVDGGARVAAVGPGTARALEAAGLDVALTARPSTAEQLVASWPSIESSAGTTPRTRPARILFPRGDLAAPTLADGLRARGWQVDDVVAYRTVPADPPPREIVEAWRDGTIRAALLTSASTVRELVTRLGAPPSGTLLVAIGPTTAAEAHRHGLTLAATAPEQTMTGLVSALEAAARKEQQ